MMQTPRFYLIVFICLSISAPLQALPAWSCFPSFAGLSADNPADRELVFSTYEALLDLPRDSGVKERLLADILSSGDPFRIPEGEGELLAVRRRMKEFSKMLEGLSWTRAELIKGLLARISQRIAARTVADTKLAVAIRGEITAVTDRPLAGAGGAALTKDGRYLIGEVAKDHLEVLDTVTGQTSRTGPFPGPALKSPILNGDETKVVYVQAGSLRIFDFANGKLAPAFAMPEPSWLDRLLGVKPSPIENLTSLPNPDWMMGHYGNYRGIYLFDLKKKNYRKLTDFDPGYHAGGKVSEWTTVKGTNQVLMATATESGVVLKNAELGSEGKLGRWKETELVKWPTPQRNFPSLHGQIVAAGNHVVLNGVPSWGTVTVVSLKDGTKRKLDTPWTKLFGNPHLWDSRMAVTADGNKLAIAFPENFHAAEQGPTRVFWFDLETGNHTGSVTLPGVYTKISLDAELLVGHGEGGVKTTSHVRY